VSPQALIGSNTEGNPKAGPEKKLPQPSCMGHQYSITLWFCLQLPNANGQNGIKLSFWNKTLRATQNLAFNLKFPGNGWILEGKNSSS